MPWRRARPLRGRTCPSQPGGISSTRPVGTSRPRAGREHQLLADRGAQVEPALPGEAGPGSGRPCAAGEPPEAEPRRLVTCAGGAGVRVGARLQPGPAAGRRASAATSE